MIEKDKVNLEAMRLWVNELRTTQVPQGYGFLTQTNPDGRISQCCLGVVCELYQRHVGGLRIVAEEGGVISYNDNEHVLPTAVHKWLGLEDGAPEVHFICGVDHDYLHLDEEREECGADPSRTDDDSPLTQVTELNDGINGYRIHTFRQIADLLEATYLTER